MTFVLILGGLIAALVVFVVAVSSFAETDKGQRFMRQEHGFQQPGRRLEELCTEWKRRGGHGQPPGNLKNAFLRTPNGVTAREFLDRHGV